LIHKLRVILYIGNVYLIEIDSWSVVKFKSRASICRIYFKVADFSFCQSLDCNVFSIVNNISELIKIWWSALTFFDWAEWNSQILISISHRAIPGRIWKLRTSWILAACSIRLSTNFKQLAFCTLETIIISTLNTVSALQAWWECNGSVLSLGTCIFLTPYILDAQDNQYQKFDLHLYYYNLFPI
jgi:hypothetical protein